MTHNYVRSYREMTNLERIESLPPLSDADYGPSAASVAADYLREVGRDVAAFAPDLHKLFCDDAARCESDGDRANVAEHWSWKLAAERRRLSQVEGRE